MQSLEAEGRGRTWGTDMADLSRQGGCESYLLSYHRSYTNIWEKHTLCKPSTLPGKKRKPRITQEVHCRQQVPFPK